MKPAATATRTESRAVRHKRIIAEMSNARTLMWVGVAALIHVVLILGTSVGYIRDWYASRTNHVAVDDTKDASTPATPPAAAPAATPDAKAAAPAKADATAKPDVAPKPNAGALPAGLSDDDKKMSERSNSPTIKKITAAAKPDELPKGPQRNAFDIDDSPK